MENPANATVALLNDYPKDRFNVLVPVATMQALSALQKVTVNMVRLNIPPSPKDSKDIYFEKSSSRWAITKVGGMKLAAAANISIVGTEPGRTEVCQRCIEMAAATGHARSCGNCLHVNDVAVTVTIRVPEPSGGFRLMAATKEIDCTLEADSMKDGADGAQYKRFLTHRTAMAESKAFMRAIRAALGLSGTYALDELKKPFIIARVVPNLDAPEIRDAVAANYLQSMGMLFEAPAARPALAGTKAPVPEVIKDDGQDGPEAGNWPDEPDGPEPEVLICADCDNPITDTAGKDGQLWTAMMVYEYSVNRFKRPLCPTCQDKAKVKAKAAKGGGQ